MKKILAFLPLVFAMWCSSLAQKKEVENENNEHIKVPTVVQETFQKKYPDAKNVAWEKEDGNYEANWGGKSGEDNSVQFMPSGDFIEIIKAIPVSQLPKNVMAYVKEHYNGAKITEAGMVTDAQGKLSYEAEVNRKDILFDESGNFLKAE